MSGNPLGLEGIEFVEFASPEPEALHRLFLAFGFSRVMRHRTRAVDLYRQGDITFLLNREPGSFAESFRRLHGPSICAMGWRVRDPNRALRLAVERGATEAGRVDHTHANGRPMAAVWGIGESLLYLVERAEYPMGWESRGFVPLAGADLIRVPEKGFLAIDHLTNNVPKGHMARWADFYKRVFGFTEVRHFDIRGEKTGLTSYALRSPCGTFSIPINEADEARSQINEYLAEYRGPGVQHLAFLTREILASLRAMDGTGVAFLDIEPDYYARVFERVPGVREDRALLRSYSVLVDGDSDGYLLQIFTRNLIGPIFVEIIQRENHRSFGEGNFGALFRSIERDQMRRGVFEGESAGA